MNSTIILRLIAAYNFIMGIIVLFPLLMLAAVSSMMAFSSAIDQQRHAVSYPSVVIVVLLIVGMIAGVIFLDRGLLRLRNRYRIAEMCLCALQVVMLIGMLSKTYGHSVRAIVVSAVFTVIPLSIIAWLAAPSVRSKFTD
ncbi:MAG TPA: hypothetical protein PLG31_02035 [Spirochaetota bacterium]|nr:hypothetical protein [Spirochaetota bacterium]